jgi:hypothetical protein
MVGILILFNFGKIYYLYSLVDFNKNLEQRAKVVELIKAGKLNNYSYNGSTDWINLPDSLKYLSNGGNVRVEFFENKISVFFYKNRESADPTGFAYFDEEITKDKLMKIKNPDSFFFGEKWVRKLNANWYYVAKITIVEPAP